MDKETLLMFVKVMNLITNIASSPKSESDITAVRTLLVRLNETIKGAILNFDNNIVDKFLVDVANGVFGTDFKTKVERIHKPRGPQAGKKSDEELLAEAFGIELDA